jgi:hypothetical protein
MANKTGKGWFEKGHRRGGRPTRATEERYLRAAVAACPMRRWKAILAKAVDLAELGEAKSERKEVGKPWRTAGVSHLV